MQSKIPNPKSHLRDFIRVADYPKLKIFSEGETKPIYNPRNSADIDKLCEAANLKKFIKDSAKVKYPHLLVFESGRYARGVVANEPIKKNQLICVYLGEKACLEKIIDRDRVTRKVKKEFAAKNETCVKTLEIAIDAYIKRVSAYAFELKRKTGPKDTVLAHNKRSLAAFINHHTTDPNVHVELVNQEIHFIASRDIEKGEQLSIDYGPDYEYEDLMYYIPSTDNHLRRGKFLAENLEYYDQRPVKLTQKQQRALGTTYTHVMLPICLKHLLQNKVPKKITEYEKRLPVLEVIYSKKHHVYVPENQQNIMPVHLACALKNAFTIRKLITDFQIDLFAKTAKHRDSLIIILNSVKKEAEFLRYARFILPKKLKQLKRIDSLGTDGEHNTVLHILVQKNWAKAVKKFDHKIFFDVIDQQDFDPLMAAIAQGKIAVLKSLLKLNCVAKRWRSLLLAKEERAEKIDYVLKRALENAPKKTGSHIRRLLKLRNNHTIRQLLFNDIRFLDRN